MAEPWLEGRTNPVSFKFWKYLLRYSSSLWGFFITLITLLLLWSLHIVARLILVCFHTIASLTPWLFLKLVNFLANLGLQPICTMIASSGSGKPLSQLAGMDPESLQKFLDKFDNFLVAPDVFLLPQTRLLSSSAHRKTVTKRSLQVRKVFPIDAV